MIESDYKPHPVLYFDPDHLMTVTLEKIQEANPNLKIGEKAHGGQRVWEGKIVPTYLTPTSDMQLDYKVPHAERPYVLAGSTRAAKLYFQDPNGFDLFKEASGYIHPIQIRIPHAVWLKTQKPGDVVYLTDTDFDTSPHTLTQEDFNNHAYVLFHFVLSDQ